MNEAEASAALFAGMVLQLTNTALVFLGKTPGPAGGEPAQDLQAAELFIAQLEMLEGKTKGNLTPEEQRFLAQSLMTVRMAFVETVNAPPAPAPTPPPAPSPDPAAPVTTGASPTGEPDPLPAATGEADSRKRFSKKY